MGAPKLIVGLLGLLAALVVLVVGGFSSLLNLLALDVYERHLLVPPELEAFYRQVEYETGVGWAVLAAWDGAENSFRLSVPTLEEIFAGLVEKVLDARRKAAEEYCNQHPEDNLRCPPGPVFLDPEEVIQLLTIAHVQWRTLVKAHMTDHAMAITLRLVAFSQGPESVYRLFLPGAPAGVAAELYEGYLILEELDAPQDVLIPVSSTPIAWEPVDGFAWPASGPITSRVGLRYSPIDGQLRLHSGIDLGLAPGTPVMASREGTVIEAGFSQLYGRYVVVQHGGGYRSLYAHISALAVSVGETVSQGKVVAYAGSSGQSTGPHLHFEIHYQGMPVDSLLLLTDRVITA